MSSISPPAGLGAAIACVVGLKLHPDYPGAVRAMTRVVRSFEPSAADAALYERFCRRGYLRMYGRLAPLYTQIQCITGYPKPD